MYNKEAVISLVDFITERNSIMDKAELSKQVQEHFKLTKDRSVYYGDWFAIRYCKSTTRNLSNTVLGLSVLQKYDDKPFFVCIVTPGKNHILIANSTFLKKISHSSHELRVDNIKGSFNGSDIMRYYDGVENIPENFEFLFTSHENFTFKENLQRLVESTNNINPFGKRFVPTNLQIDVIYDSVRRAKEFMSSNEYHTLNKDLSERVNAAASEIAIAAFIENVNLRGRIIEFLITAPDDFRETLTKALVSNEPLPEIFTDDDLGDYEKKFIKFHTKTDIKTKIMFLSSNPKGYNIDKLLSFLSNEKSVYLIYIVAIDSDKKIKTRLCSMYNDQLLSGTRIIKHWAGRNSRGVSQYDGRALESIITKFDPVINDKASRDFIEMLLVDDEDQINQEG